MENWTPIDDLFRDKLGAGKEQLNLGAWANMERMLDGKNPYSSDETKKKRRILPFLGIFLLLSSLFTAGYYILDKKQDKLVQHSESQHAKESLTKNTPSTDIAVSQTNQSTSASPLDLPNNEPSIESLNKQPTVTPVSSTPKKTTQKLVSNFNNDESNNPSTTPVPGNSNLKIQKAKQKTTSSNAFNQTTANVEKLTTSSPKLEANQSSKLDLVTVEKQDQPKLDTIPQVEVKQQITRARNGNISAINYDTVGISQTTKEKQFNSNETNQTKEEKKALLPEVSNPRYVKLDAASEELAQRKSELPEMSTQMGVAIVNEVKNTNEPNSNVTLQNATASKEKKATSSKKTSYFQDMMIAARDNYNKLRQHPILLYPGISVGISTSISQHNFGGFHFGVNNLIPINNYFTVLTELKLFYRNNSGFTINDTKSVTKDQSEDNVTLSASNQTIYSTQSEQTVKKYNFKHFSMLELPILLQGHYRSLMAYGGLNLSYNFKLKTNEIIQSSSLSQIDTLENSIPHPTPIEKSFEFSKDDFRSRFGIGYVVGAGYNFNPNIYIDLRVSQNLWDNAKTSAQREVSNGFFKVPYIQFSVGYRFKKFSANQ
jgi:hypothetical protein